MLAAYWAYVLVCHILGGCICSQSNDCFSGSSGGSVLSFFMPFCPGTICKGFGMTGGSVLSATLRTFFIPSCLSSGAFGFRVQYFIFMTKSVVITFADRGKIKMLPTEENTNLLPIGATFLSLVFFLLATVVASFCIINIFFPSKECTSSK